MGRRKDKVERILSKHVCKEDIDNLSKNVWHDIIDAMIEYGNKRSRSSGRASKEIDKLNSM